MSVSLTVSGKTTGESQALEHGRSLHQLTVGMEGREEKIKGKREEEVKSNERR